MGGGGYAAVIRLTSPELTNPQWTSLECHFWHLIRRILRKTSRCCVGVKRVEIEADSELTVTTGI